MNKQRTIAITLIPIIVLFLILGTLHYLAATYENFTYPEHVESYLLAGFITAEIILNMINWLMQDKNNVRSELKEHTKEINKIFIRMTESYIRMGKEGLAITLPRENSISNSSLMRAGLNPQPDGYYDRVDIKYVELHPDIYYFYEFALKHLETIKYKNIFKHWKKTEELLKEFNSRPEKIIPRIGKEVNKKIDDFFPNFQEHWGESKSPDFYEPQSITSMIKILLDYPTENYHRFFIKQRNEMNIVASKYDQTVYFLGSKDKIKLEQFTKFIDSIRHDKEITKINREESELDSKIRNELGQFTEKLKPLVKQLKANKLLDGKCDGCP